MKTKVIQSRLDDGSIAKIQEYSKSIGLSFSMTVRLILLEAIKRIEKNDKSTIFISQSW